MDRSFNVDPMEVTTVLLPDRNGKKVFILPVIENDISNGAVTSSGLSTLDLVFRPYDACIHRSFEVRERAIGAKFMGKVVNGPTYSTNLGVIVSDGLGVSKNVNGEGRTKFPRETMDVDTKVRSDVMDRRRVDHEHPCGGGPLSYPCRSVETFAITSCANTTDGTGFAS